MVLNDRAIEPQERARIHQQLVTEIGEEGIERHGAAYLIALQAHLYDHRK